MQFDCDNGTAALFSLAVFALALCLCVVALLLGPALAYCARRSALFETAVEGLRLGLIPALILVRLLPQLAVEIGPIAIGLFAAAYLGFSWFERRTRARSARVGADVVTAALAAHSFTDGAALAIAFDGARWFSPTESALLAGALVLHRAPEGLFIASTLLPAAGIQATLRRIGLLVAATLLGALSGRGLLQRVPDAVLGALLAAGLGIMLRVIVHRHRQRAEGPRARGLAAVCFVASAALVLLLPRAQDLLSQALQQEPPLVGALRASYRNLVAMIR